MIDDPVVKVGNILISEARAGKIGISPDSIAEGMAAYQFKRDSSFKKKVGGAACILIGGILMLPGAIEMGVIGFFIGVYFAQTLFAKYKKANEFEKFIRESIHFQK